MTEVPDRTSDYQDRIRARRRQLRKNCAALLAAQPAFVWEIGCGHGHFLTGYATEHSDRLCIGIDIVLERIERANRKRERAQLPNLHFVRAEAGDFLAALPANAAITEIYVLFPDPWPKRRHWKNRLMDADFLGSAARRTGQGTRLYFRTDHEPYHLAVAALIKAHPDWQARPDAPWPFELPTVFQKRASRYQSIVAERV